jgi:hydrogenase maturation protein HypF
VQHHHAHIASVMAEHGLAGPVIGIAFDGTGYGTDGTIWGGEVLVCEGAGFERYSHLRQIEMIGGDASMRDGWKSAISRLSDHQRQIELTGGNPPTCEGRNAALSRLSDHQRQIELTGGNPPTCEGRNAALSRLSDHQRQLEMPGDASMRDGWKAVAPRAFEIDLSDIIKNATAYDTLREYEGEQRTICAAIVQGVNTVTTSSMGRLFDAVASLLGIHHVNRYEGECAIMLENAAWRASQTGSMGSTVSTISDEADALALHFHHAVANTILAQCRAAREERGLTAVCLSGGVFQNKILMEETLRLLRADGFTPYYNIAVPPNDGGIALGQAYVAMRSIR